MFIRQTGVDFKSLVRQLPPETVKSLIVRLRKSHEVEEPCKEDKKAVTSFFRHLKENYKVLNESQQVMKNLAVNQSNFNKQHIIFTTYLLKEYEEQCLVEYIQEDFQKLIFSQNGEEEHRQSIMQMHQMKRHNSFYHIYIKIKEELQEIISMQLCIQQLFNY